MKWILFYQNQYDAIRYVSEDLTPSFLNYKKFINFISPYVRYQVEAFFTEINKFSTIFLDCETGKWNIVPPDEVEGAFKDLLKINEKKPENDKSGIDIKLLKKSKDYITNILRQKNNKNGKK